MDRNHGLTSDGGRMAIIRDYSPNDDDEIIAAWEKASRLAHSFLSEDFLVEEAAAIRKTYLPNTRTLVAEEDGAVIGFASMLGDELGALFLDPACHGRGVGRALLKAAASGREFVDVEVFERNPIGRRFYEKCGFQETGQSVHARTGETLIRMRLRRREIESSVSADG